MEFIGSETGSQGKVPHDWIRVRNGVLLGDTRLGAALLWGGFVGGGLSTPGGQWPPPPEPEPQSARGFDWPSLDHCLPRLVRLHAEFLT